MSVAPDVSPTTQNILADEAASSWLRSALQSALKRDPRICAPASTYSFTLLCISTEPVR